MESTMQTYLTMAQKAMKHAYVPYSQFHVGACLVCADGSIYTGCNIENASYGVTVCAERVALWKAVSEGKREFSLLALTSDNTEITYPCGICRQALLEFSPDLLLVCASKNLADAKQVRLSDLLPHSFSKKDLSL